MDIYLYIDASGQSNTKRLWGTYLIIGLEQNNALNHIIEKFLQKCENFNELKGKWLCEGTIKEIVSEVGKNTSGYFDCSRYEVSKAAQQDFLHKIKKIPSKKIVPFYTNLKKINQIKFIGITTSLKKSLQKLSIFPHTSWQNLHVYIDNENLPMTKEYQESLYDYALYQIIRPITKIKNIYLHEACNSQKIPGIQFVDIVLSYVRDVFEDMQNVTIDI